MPRFTDKKILQRQLNAIIWQLLLTPLSEPIPFENLAINNLLEDLFTLLQALESFRYLQRRVYGSAGRLSSGDNIEIIQQFLNYPTSAFLANFRMRQESFLALVELLTIRGGDNWFHNTSQSAANLTSGRPILIQVAVALYILGSANTSFERVCMKLNIGKGTSQVYLWRTIDLLFTLLPEFIQWPSTELRRQQRLHNDDLFTDCIGYLDGSEIPLRDRPSQDPEAYFSRKKIYGFNLQAVCNDYGQFIYAYMGHIASTHDSTAFKASSLYRDRQKLLNDSEYLLADKAYQLDKHLITPFKQPYPHHSQYSTFNKAHSRQRIRIEHAFGVLKSRWASLKGGLPIRIRSRSIQKDHNRVIRWTIACLVLHNFLLQRGEEDNWLDIEDDGEDDQELSPAIINDNPELRQIGEQRRAILYQKLQDLALSSL